MLHWMVFVEWFYSVQASGLRIPGFKLQSLVVIVHLNKLSVDTLHVCRLQRFIFFKETAVDPHLGLFNNESVNFKKKYIFFIQINTTTELLEIYILTEECYISNYISRIMNEVL